MSEKDKKNPFDVFEQYNDVATYAEKGLAKVKEEVRLAELEISAINEGKHINPVMLLKLLRGAIEALFTGLGYEAKVDQVDQLLKESFGMILDRIERKVQLEWNWNRARDLVIGYCNGRIVGSEPSCPRVRLEKAIQR